MGLCCECSDDLLFRACRGIETKSLLLAPKALWSTAKATTDASAPGCGKAVVWRIHGRVGTSIVQLAFRLPINQADTVWRASETIETSWPGIVPGLVIKPALHAARSLTIPLFRHDSRPEGI